MGKASAPAIDEVVGFLNKHSAVTLQSLRERYPDAADLLRPGIMMGPEVNPQIAVRAATCLAALGILSKTVTERLPALRVQLYRARQLRIASQIVVLVTSTSTGAVTAFAEASALTKNIVSGIAIIAAIFALLSQELMRPSYGGNDSLIESYLKLTEGCTNADELIRDLEAWKTQGFAGADEVGLITRANALLAEVGRIERRL